MDSKRIYLGHRAAKREWKEAIPRGPTFFRGVEMGIHARSIPFSPPIGFFCIMFIPRPSFFSTALLGHDIFRMIIRNTEASLIRENANKCLSQKNESAEMIFWSVWQLNVQISRREKRNAWITSAIEARKIPLKLSNQKKISVPFWIVWGWQSHRNLIWLTGATEAIFLEAALFLNFNYFFTWLIS